LAHALDPVAGGFAAARAAAAEAAGIAVDQTRLVLYPRPPTLLEYLTGEARPALLARWLRSVLAPDPGLPASLQTPPEITRLRHPF
jgi:hypothetical protein